MPSDTQPQVKPARDPALDGLRGVAILLVYLFHYGGGVHSSHLAVRCFGYFVEGGWVGVPLFFALSGFLITGILWPSLSHPHALRNFFARRALRILPIYYGALLAAAFAALIVGARAGPFLPLLVYAGFLQNMPPLVQLALHAPPPLPLVHLWSLAVEEQFYLLWPFLLLAARTRARALRLCFWIFGLSCAFRAVLFPPHVFPGASMANWSPFLLTRAGGLVLGAALALTPRERWPGRGLALVALALGAAVFVAVGVLSGTLVLAYQSQFIFALPAVDIACAAVLVLALEAEGLRRLLSLAPLRLLGRISYGFYVLHLLLEPAFDAIARWTIHAGTGDAYQTVRLLVGFPITFAAAWLSFTFFERPFLRLKRLFPRVHTSIA